MTRILLMIALLLVAACQPTPSPPAAPTVIPFPTVTPGRVIRGIIGPQANVPIANPATAVALASQPTVTPDIGTCPSPSDVTLPDEVPSDSALIANEIVRYLSAGGAPSDLEDALRETWEILGEDGFLRSDLDLTGEGTPEIILGYSVPEGGGTLLIVGCTDQRYVSRYRAVSDEASPPEILLLEDMNRDGLNDILFTSRACDADQEACSYRTQLITWRPDVGRFASLLGTTITSDIQPEIDDMDEDGVTEIIVDRENTGTRSTGPLRTGVYIYDWNGNVYVLSIVQLDPPRFRIQIIQQADRHFAQDNIAEAISLYQLSLIDPSLRSWFNDDGPILESYALYRLMLAQAVREEDITPIFQRIVETFPNPADSPIFVRLSSVFWDTYAVTNDLSNACSEVRNVVAAEPDALDLLNRYGSQSPTYTARDLCPF